MGGLPWTLALIQDVRGFALSAIDFVIREWNVLPTRHVLMLAGMMLMMSAVVDAALSE